MGVTVMAGGGTGGHIFPALAVADALLEGDGESVAWIGSRSRSDRRLVEGRGIPYFAIPAGKLRRYFSLRNALDVFNIAGGVLASLAILLRLRPEVLFSKGGFVSVPPALAAWLLRIPVVSHECDLTPGLATRINALLSRAVLVSFPETVPCLGRASARAVVTGNPVRSSIVRGDRIQGRRMLGVPDGRPVLLVTGGSLGAQALNAAVASCRDGLTERCFVVHQRGRHPGPERAPGYFSAPFFSAEYPDLLAAADLVVCRAGANNLSELAALGKPALLVPLPLGSSRGDQIANAAHHAQAGAAEILPQSRLDGRSLLAAVDGLLSDPARLAAMGRAARGQWNAEAAGSIARIVIAARR